ncbi:MAG: ABC transporter permease [Desulfobacterales bacterium]|nr:ABC transporter permease [Desulfobacterales bacterium]
MKTENQNSREKTGPGAVERQELPPFVKSVEIAYKSIRVRFFRSLITTMTLVLAVSFLSFVNVSNDSANGLLQSGNPEFRQALIKSGYDLDPADVQVGSKPKQRWIVILSLLVCVVGIINAQLMAVTERFREIGTMKCLGALDRFIMRLFLLEAVMQGFVGSVAGALFGGLFAILSGALQFGAPAVRMLAWGDVIQSMAMAAAVGCLLSLIGVLYPARVAARMQPVEAMRVER